MTLYWAKSDGRGRWATFDAERNARDMTSYTVLATLGQGVERNEFHVVYQPIVDLADRRVLGVEALVRWEHPVLGYLTPDQFIGHAEDSGLIVPLGRAVLDQACTEIADWNAAHPDRPLYVSVNLAAAAGRRARPWSARSPRCSTRTGLPAELLQLEVTESDLLGPAGRQVDAISSLAAMGIRMALDDFGSGYSNLGYLPRLPLHTLKIAGILVEGLRDRTAGAVPVVANLVQLAHELGLQVTAEAVETGDQAAQLRDCGCDSAQGWLYAKAAPLSALTYLLEGDPPTELPDRYRPGGPGTSTTGQRARCAQRCTTDPKIALWIAPCPWFPRTISCARWACSSSTAVGSPRTTSVCTGTSQSGGMASRSQACASSCSCSHGSTGMSPSCGGRCQTATAWICARVAQACSTAHRMAARDAGDSSTPTRMTGRSSSASAAAKV